jgi:hypothetical protein
MLTTWNMGFIGYYGEEWGTANATVANLSALWRYIRSIWGDGIFLGVRRLETLQALVIGEPEATTGFDSYIPGHYNDYIAGNATDANTYTGSAAVQQTQRNLAKATAHFFPIGGETHYVDQSPYGTNPNSWVAYYGEYNYNYIRHFYQPTIDLMNAMQVGGISVNQWCRRYVGARIYLQNAKIPQTLTRGQSASFQFTVINRGTVNTTHPRGFELVLENVSSGAIVRIPFHNPTQGGDRPQDPRRWINTHTFTATANIPSNIAAGSWRTKLFLPDGRGLPVTNPRFAFRLACQNMWESATGYNNLDQVVTVT